MVKVDTSPVCCTGVATLTGIEAQYMTSRFAGGDIAVMADYT